MGGSVFFLTALCEKIVRYTFFRVMIMRDPFDRSMYPLDIPMFWAIIPACENEDGKEKVDWQNIKLKGQYNDVKS